MVRSFDHLARRDADRAVTTLFADLGWSGTRVAIAHGTQVVFARYIQMGGRHFDQLIASSLRCNLAAARGHRLALDRPPAAAGVAKGDAEARPSAAAGPQVDAARQLTAAETAATAQTERRAGAAPREFVHAIAPSDATPPPASVDLTELLDTITDELSMCLRYHRGLFPERPIDRTIFLGGEARQIWLCQHVVKALR